MNNLNPPGFSKYQEEIKLNTLENKIKEIKSSRIGEVATEVLKQNLENAKSHAQIILCLHELLMQSEKMGKGRDATIQKVSLKILEEDSLKLLDKILSSDDDISLRLKDIAQHKFTTPEQQCRQLRDMQLYLTLISCKSEDVDTALTPEEKKKLEGLVRGVRAALEQFTQATAPPWTTHLDKLEVLIKQELPKDAIISPEDSLLKVQQGPEIDPRTFASILLESMIKGSKELEGNVQSKVIGYLHAYLESKQAKYSGIEAFPGLLRMFRDADKLCLACDGLSENISSEYSYLKFPKYLEKFTKALSSNILALHPGEKTLVPIGWTGRYSGHAMEMGIEMCADQSYRVFIYNLGDGISEFHPSLVENGAPFYQPFVEIAGVQKERLLQPKFAQALLEMLLISDHPSKNGGSTHYGPKDIYNLILKGLGGEPAPVSGDRDKFMPPQFSGTCTWASLSAVLHTHLPLPIYYTILTDISVDSLCAYYHLVKDTLSTNIESRQMLQQAIKTCAQIALESHANQGIDLKRVRQIYATLQELQTELDAAEGQHLYGKIGEEQLAFEDLEPYQRRYLSINSEELKPPMSDESAKLPTKGSSLNPFSFDWLDDPQKMLKQVDFLVKVLQIRMTTEYAEEAIRILETFFKMQAQAGREKVWEQIPESQLSALTVQLTLLTEQVIRAAEKKPQNMREYITYAHYLSMLVYQLALRNPESKDIALQMGMDFTEYLKFGHSFEQEGAKFFQDRVLFNPEERALSRRILETVKSLPNKGYRLIIHEDGSTLEKYNYNSEYPYVYPDMLYIDNLQRKDPTLKDKLKKVHPEFPELENEQDLRMALALSDWYGKVLPPAFCALRRQAQIMYFFMQNKAFKYSVTGSIATEVVKEPNGSYRLKYKSKPNQLKSKKRDFISEEILEDVRDIRNWQLLPKQLIYKKFNELSDEDFSVSHGRDVNAQIYDSESDVLLNDYRWDKHMQLILTRGDYNEQNPFLEQQVTKTIAYFSEHIGELADHDKRMLCRFLLFEQRFVEKLLEIHPGAGQVIAKFVRSGYHHFMERENIAAALFFIEIGRNFEALSQHIKIFEDVRKECGALLGSREWSREEKTLIFQQIAASYLSHPPADFTQDDATLLLKALIHDEVFALKQHKETEHLRDQMQRALWTRKWDIEKLLKSPVGADICHSIVLEFDPRASKQTWDCVSQYPLCISQDGTYAIQVNSLGLYIKNSPIKPIPQSVLLDEKFKAIFSKKDYVCRQLEWNTYAFTDERGFLSQVQTQGIEGINPVKTIRQKHEDGQWYVLRNIRELGTYIYSLPADFLKLCDQSSVWVTLDPQQPMKIVVRDSHFTVTHTIPVMKGVQAPDLTLEEQTQLYEFLVRKKNAPGEHMEKMRNKILEKFQYLARSFGQLTNEQMKEIKTEQQHVKQAATKDFFANLSDILKTQENKDAWIEKFMAAQPESRLMEILQQIYTTLDKYGETVLGVIHKENVQDPPWLLVDVHSGKNPLVSQLFGQGMLWKDAKILKVRHPQLNQDLELPNLKTLELPSMVLSFEMQLEGTVWMAYSREYPGYYVSPNQRYRGIEPVKGAIVLENKEGKRKLILPFGEIHPKQTGSFSTKSEIIVLNDSQTPSIAYDLDKVSKPIAKQRAQQLYLANLLFIEKKYDQAQGLLRASFSHVLPYTEQDVKLLYDTLAMLYHTRDNSPHAGAVASTAMALLYSYEKTSPWNQTKDIFWLEVIKNRIQACVEGYINYKRQAATVPDLKLMSQEEAQAVAFLSKALQDIEESDERSSPEISRLKSKLNNCTKTRFIMEEGSMEKPSVTKPTGAKVSTTPTMINDALSKYEPNNLLTRPQAQFLNQFDRLYALALKDPVELELHLCGATQDEKVPQDLVTFLRAAAYAHQHPDDQMKEKFPPSQEELRTILQKKDAQAFTSLLMKASQIEKDLYIQKAYIAEDPIFVIGTSKTFPRLEETQKIWPRTQAAAGIELSELNPRKKMLKASQESRFFESIDNGGLWLEAREIEALKQAIQGPDASTSKEAAERAQHIQSYWSQEVHTLKWHKLKPEMLDKAKTLLLVEQAEMGKALNVAEQQLLNFANAMPAEEQDALLFELEKTGHVRQAVNLRDLLIFTARASYFSLAGKNPQLTLREKELMERSLLYLEAKARQQQLNRALAAIQELEKVDIRDTDTYNRTSERCWQELSRIPPYEAHKHPELLVFEVLEDIGLHDWQVKDLKRMLRPEPGENPNIIVEKVMGSGKTKVYLPLIALSKADGEHLSLIVVHSSQYDTVAQAMQIKSGENFAQVAHTLQFSRSSDTSLEALKKIRDDCQQIIRQRHFMVVTDKSLHSLSLAFSELWDSYLSKDKEDAALAARLDVMREIMNLLKTQAKATLDEADLLLNCRYEVVYSLGQAEPIEADHANVVAELYRSLEAHLRQLEPFTLAEYNAKKPLMIKAFIEAYVVKEMPARDPELILDYLKEGKAGAEYVATLPEKERDRLAIVYYEFKELLPIVLDRRCGEHYGYSDLPNKILPVPYVASGVPSPTAEFSFPYALLDYAMQTLKSEGVSPALLRRLVQEMQNQAVREQNTDPTLPLEQTEAFKAFCELCGRGTPSEVLIPFLRTNDDDISKLARMYKKQPPDIYGFAKKYVFPAVTMHHRKLASTPYALGKMFKETQGFTGTPWNYKTYPHGLDTLRDMQSAGKTEGIIWKNSQIVHSLKTSDFKAIMQDIARLHAKDKYHAFIDVGAMFNGYDNRTVAEGILDTLPETIRGVLFFNDNRPCVLERGKKELIPFESGQDTKNLYIFYDQWHTTGQDFSIAGKSLLSFGKNTKMRDLEQGYMRDRKAAQGKRVEFILSKETDDYIKKDLRFPLDETIGTMHLLKAAQNNQDRELDDQLIMAALGKIKEVLNQHLRSLQLNTQIPPAVIREKADKIRHLIGDAVRDAPYDELGSSKQTILGDTDKNKSPNERFFTEVIDQAAEKMKEFLADTVLCPEGLTLDTLKAELWSCIDLKLLPEKISSAAPQAANQLVEQQSQQQSQQERMALVNKELLSDMEKETERGPIHWNFDSRQKTYSSAFYRVMKVEDLLQCTKEQLPLYDMSTRALKPKSSSQAPFLALADIFTHEDHLKAYADVFDIEVSYNFLPIISNTLKESDIITVRSHPFRNGQLAVNNILICRNVNTGDVQVRLINQADAGFFFQQLSEKPREAVEKQEMEVTLYHKTLKVLQSNNEAIANGKQQVIDPAVLKKIVQAKFFNGESLYSKEEMKYLKAWIEQKGADRMEQLFTQQVLPYKPDKQKEYPGSPLAKIFAKGF